jgi:hypothetical protein
VLLVVLVRYNVCTFLGRWCRFRSLLYQYVLEGGANNGRKRGKRRTVRSDVVVVHEEVMENSSSHCGDVLVIESYCLYVTNDHDRPQRNASGVVVVVVVVVVVEEKTSAVVVAAACPPYVRKYRARFRRVCGYVCSTVLSRRRHARPMLRVPPAFSPNDDESASAMKKTDRRI